MRALFLDGIYEIAFNVYQKNVFENIKFNFSTDIENS